MALRADPHQAERQLPVNFVVLRYSLCIDTWAVEQFHEFTLSIKIWQERSNNSSVISPFLWINVVFEAFYSSGIWRCMIRKRSIWLFGWYATLGLRSWTLEHPLSKCAGVRISRSSGSFVMAPRGREFMTAAIPARIVRISSTQKGCCPDRAS